jgi:hypothetical protein
MEQHPVPQNISSYEFRLVGDMTLKQFFQLAGGALVAFILYKTNLPFIIKGPLVLLSALTGVLLAFVPVNGRPFSQWVLAFIKAIYSPTEFYWSPATATVPSEPLPPTDNPETLKSKSPLDKFEEQLFSRFSQLFNGQTPPPLPSTPPSSVSQPSPIPVATPTVAHLPEVDIPPAPKPTQTMMSHMQTVTPPSPVTPPPPPVAQASPPPPQTTPSVAPTPPPAVIPPTTRPTQVPILDRTLKTEAIASSPANLPLPEQPNILTGQIVNAAHQIVEGVIVEIAEASSGIPVRALRTNKLGQFQIATPLPQGQYIIQAEKDGFSFDPISILADNKIISPILITAKA